MEDIFSDVETQVGEDPSSLALALPGLCMPAGEEPVASALALPRLLVHGAVPAVSRFGKGRHGNVLERRLLAVHMVRCKITKCR